MKELMVGFHLSSWVMVGHLDAQGVRDGDGGVCGAVTFHLLCFVGVQLQVVVVAQGHQLLHLTTDRPIEALLVICLMLHSDRR